MSSRLWAFQLSSAVTANSLPGLGKICCSIPNITLITRTINLLYCISNNWSHKVIGFFTYPLGFVPRPSYREAAYTRGKFEDGYKWQSHGEIIQSSWESTTGFTLSSYFSACFYLARTIHAFIFPNFVRPVTNVNNSIHLISLLWRLL